MKIIGMVGRCLPLLILILVTHNNFARAQSSLNNLCPPPGRWVQGGGGNVCQCPDGSLLSLGQSCRSAQPQQQQQQQQCPYPASWAQLGNGNEICMCPTGAVYNRGQPCTNCAPGMRYCSNINRCCPNGTVCAVSGSGCLNQQQDTEIKLQQQFSIRVKSRAFNTQTNQWEQRSGRNSTIAGKSIWYSSIYYRGPGYVQLAGATFVEIPSEKYEEICRGLESDDSKVQQSALALVYEIGFNIGAIAAAELCEQYAKDKYGSPFRGAVMVSFMKKCVSDHATQKTNTDAEAPAYDAVERCKQSAIDINGNPLRGAAMTSFMKMCVQR